MPTTSKKSKPSYLYAIIGVSLVLFLLGIIGWLVLDGRALTQVFRESVPVTVDFHDNSRDEKIAQLQAVLKKQPFVKDVRLITKDEALKIASEMEGENTGEFLGYNPLFASLELKVHEEYVQPDSLEKIRQFVLQSNIVREVTYPQAEVRQINYNFRKINLILGGVALLLFIAVIILIDNTVRLAMFSNRFLIKTMQMVGAEQRFISRPFDQRAVINGLISGIVAAAGVVLVKNLVESRYPEMERLLPYSSMIALVAGILALGVLISLISTHRSVVKYLKLHVDDLY